MSPNVILSRNESLVRISDFSSRRRTFSSVNKAGIIKTFQKCFRHTSYHFFSQKLKVTLRSVSFHYGDKLSLTIASPVREIKHTSRPCCYKTMGGRMALEANEKTNFRTRRRIHCQNWFQHVVFQIVQILVNKVTLLGLRGWPPQSSPWVSDTSVETYWWESCSKMYCRK